MTTHQDIHLSTLDYRRLSEPFELFTISMNRPLDTTDDLQEFLNYSRELIVVCTKKGNLNAVVYWFDMNLIDDLTISTLSPLYHWSQAAVVCREVMPVSSGTPVEVKASCRNSCISIETKCDKW